MPLNKNKTEYQSPQSREQEDRSKKYWDLFQEYRQIKEQNVRFLNKDGISRNIIDYIKDSVDRMNEFHAKPDHKEAWQNNVFDPITRDKVIAILSRMAATRMKPEILAKMTSIFATDDTALRKSIYSDLLENANIHNKDDVQLVWEMFTGLSEGTVIGYEGWRKGTRDVEYVTEFDPDTGEKKSETIKHDEWDDVYGEIVPIEEFYPETIWTHKFDNIKRCFRVREIKYDTFIDRYGKYKQAKKVQPARFYSDVVNLDWGISADVEGDNVQIIEWYDQINDKYGLWANTLELYWGCLPFNHKKIPFWLSQAEPIHHQFLFGKSLPDKLMGMQDINNAVFNAMLDQLYLALNSPIFIAGSAPEEMNDGYLEPGRYYEVAPDTRVEATKAGNVDQTAFQMLSLIKRSMEESSVSAQAQGVPTGGRKTKFEVQALQEGALSLAGLFLQMMEGAMWQKYYLRLYNVLQYYSMPSRKKTGKKKFKFIELDNRKLTNGKMGKRMIQIVDNKNEVPNTEELRAIATRTENKDFNLKDSRVEPIVLTRDYLKNNEVELDIRIVPNSSVKETEVDKKNKDIAFFQATQQNPLVNQEQNLRDFARAFNKPDDIIKKQEDVMAEQEGEIPGLPGMAGMRGQPAPANAQPDMELL